MALQEGQRGFVAEVDGDFRVNLPFQLHHLPDPVSCQEGEVGEALVDRSSGERRQSQTYFNSWCWLCLRYLMVIIFLCATGESSFLMRLMFPAHWNFSELMKKTGCLTRGKVSSSRGNIQASKATPHLNKKLKWNVKKKKKKRQISRRESNEILLLEFLLFAESLDNRCSPKGMTHDGYPTQIHGVLAAEARNTVFFPVIIFQPCFFWFFSCFLIQRLPLKWTSQTVSAERSVKEFLSWAEWVSPEPECIHLLCVSPVD